MKNNSNSKKLSQFLLLIDHFKAMKLHHTFIILWTTLLSHQQSWLFWHQQLQFKEHQNTRSHNNFYCSELWVITWGTILCIILSWIWRGHWVHSAGLMILHSTRKFMQKAQRQLTLNNWHSLLSVLTAYVCHNVKLAMVVDSCFHLLSYETLSLLGERLCFI